MRTDEFDFQLPHELIAQHPAPLRDTSRLFVLHRQDNRIEHRTFRDLLEYLAPGDVLVLNDSKVAPARLRAVNPTTGTGFEILLLEETARNNWWAMMRPAKRARVGTEMSITDLRGNQVSLVARVLGTNAEGHRHLRFEPRAAVACPAAFDIADALDDLGEVPLPPYIKRAEHDSSTEDRARYQTVYARDKGSVAAPTAGLHFTEELLSEIRGRGVEVCFVTLHVGAGTFAPVKVERIAEHTMHHERFRVSANTAKCIADARSKRRRVIAVGTTTVRVLEFVAREHQGKIVAGSGRTNIFIRPPFAFRVVDALLTNFHLPRSTLLMLVSAFAAPSAMSGRETILSAYAEAVKQRYRFFSYGDAMLIL